MGSDRDNLGRLQDIEDKPEVERLGDNRAVIRTGDVERTDPNSTDENPNPSRQFEMKVQVKRDGTVKQTKLEADSMRGLVQKFTVWASSVSEENMNDLLKKV